eukprot:m.464547 g.464547  ORF g.464547 m.464547 type:complete len:518 (+) comp21621_c0_seq1:283-1836(+)
MTAVVNVYRDVLPVSTMAEGSSSAAVPTHLATSCSSNPSVSHLKVLNSNSTVMAGPVHTPVCSSSSSSIMPPATVSTPSPGMLQCTQATGAKLPNSNVSKALSTTMHISSMQSPHKLHQTTASATSVSRSNLASSVPVRRHLHGGLSSSAYRIQELPGALDILEDLILVGMNQLQSTVNTAMPLRKRGLPGSFWNFCAADTKVAAQSSKGSSRKNLNRSGSGNNASAPNLTHSKKRDTSLFIPIKEEEISPVRPSKKSPNRSNGGNSKGNRVASQRHSTNSAEKRPKRPNTPKKTSSPATKGARRRGARAGSAGRARSPKSGRSSAGSVGVGKSAHAAIGMHGVMATSRGCVHGDMGFDLLSLHGNTGVAPDTGLGHDHYGSEHMIPEHTMFSYDYSSNDGTSTLVPEPERSMSCPVVDFGEFGAPPALYNGEMYMPSSTRSSADMPGPEAIDLLTGMEMSNVDEVLSPPSPTRIDHHVGHRDEGTVGGNNSHEDHVDHASDVFDDWAMIVDNNEGA